MINELARMRFQSSRNPAEKGAVVITDDGFLHIEPSDEFIAEIARLELQAVERSRMAGLLGSLLLFAIGGLVAFLAWARGRVGGEMRTNLTRPRPIGNLKVCAGESGRVKVTIPGDAANSVSLEWERGEVDEDEKARLIAVYKRFREIPPPS
ncbi:MAG: hypothetical protein P4L33_18095 [Capsulimonadaceae bacterium]|nr:hypothetical protein [Capsulimonadaceae bacterium]